MKTPNKGGREQQHDTDEMRKAKKLAPMRKSGKERHALYHDLDTEDEDEEDYHSYSRRESAYDYLDEEEEE